MRTEDIYGEPCQCGECIQAGVTNEKTRRDPQTGKVLHGFALRRGLDAYREFQQRARAMVGKRGRHANGFEKLVDR